MQTPRARISKPPQTCMIWCWVHNALTNKRIKDTERAVKQWWNNHHQFNWKKVGLSRAYYKKELVCAESMPTVRARAAFLFLMDHNKF